MDPLSPAPTAHNPSFASRTEQENHDLRAVLDELRLSTSLHAVVESYEDITTQNGTKRHSGTAGAPTDASEEAITSVLW